MKKVEKKKKKGVGFFANLSMRSLSIKLSRHPLTGNYVLSLNPLLYPHHFSVRIFFYLLQRDPQRKKMPIFQFVN